MDIIYFHTPIILQLSHMCMQQYALRHAISLFLKHEAITPCSDRSVCVWGGGGWLVACMPPSYYRLQTKFVKVMFLQVSVCPWGRGACMGGCMCGGGMHGRRVCMAGGYMWQRTCMAAGGCQHAWLGHVWGGMHAWQRGDVRGRYFEIRSMSKRYASY